MLDRIAELVDLLPDAVVAANEVLDFAAIAVAHRRQDRVAVRRGIQCDFCDSRKVLPELVPILGHRRSEFVKVNLLIEIEVLLWTLAFTRITRVEKA